MHNAVRLTDSVSRIKRVHVYSWTLFISDVRRTSVFTNEAQNLTHQSSFSKPMPLIAHLMDIVDRPITRWNEIPYACYLT
jgi:hypothetical protein